MQDERVRNQPPDASLGEPLSHSFTSQAVTPLTERTSRYFYSWGPNKGEGSDAIADAMMKIAQVAFGEDKRMIEAQQESIDLDPTRAELLTSADAGPVRRRRVIEALCNSPNPGVAHDAYGNSGEPASPPRL